MTIYEPADVARAVTIEARGYRIDEAIIAEAVRKMGVLVVDPASTVVLDPDNPDDVERLSVALAKYDDDESAYSVTADNVLRSLLPTPPLPEPNGLGAVVEIRDERGQDGTAVFTGGEWVARFPGFVDYQAAFYDLDVTKVLSHGVGCSCGAPDCNGGVQ